MHDKLLYAMAQLDPVTCEKMRSIDRLLCKLGIEVKKPPKVPYHITLGSFPIDREAEIKSLVEQVCKGRKRFPLSYNHIGLFGLNVLFFGPDVNEQLLQLAKPFEDKRINLHDWTAHTTLMMDEPEVILRALPVVAEQFSSFHATVDSVSLYEFWPSRLVTECRLED